MRHVSAWLSCLKLLYLELLVQLRHLLEFLKEECLLVGVLLFGLVHLGKDELLNDIVVKLDGEALVEDSSLFVFFWLCRFQLSEARGLRSCRWSSCGTRSGTSFCSKARTCCKTRSSHRRLKTNPSWCQSRRSSCPWWSLFWFRCSTWSALTFCLCGRYFITKSGLQPPDETWGMVSILILHLVFISISWISFFNIKYA